MEEHDTTPVPDDKAAVPETPVSSPLQPRDELAEQKKQCEDLNDRYLRLAAELGQEPLCVALERGDESSVLGTSLLHAKGIEHFCRTPELDRLALLANG